MILPVFTLLKKWDILYIYHVFWWALSLMMVCFIVMNYMNYEYEDWGTNLYKERKKKERRKVKGSIRSLIRPLHDRYCSFLGLSLHVVFRLTFETRNGSTPHVPSCWILTTISDVRRIAVKNVVHLPQQKTAVDLTSDSPVLNNRYLLL